jgi:hypothetical protein
VHFKLNLKMMHVYCTSCVKCMLYITMMSAITSAMLPVNRRMLPLAQCCSIHRAAALQGADQYIVVNTFC